MKNQILVVAAHPDDEVIGCGGAIARHVANGDQVYLLVMTQIYSPEWEMKGFALRRKEAQAAARSLGVKMVFFAGFPTAKLNTVANINLSSKMSEIMKKVRPEVVYLPPKIDVNEDHTLVCQAGIAACKSYRFIKKIMSYEVPTVFRFNNLEVNYYVDTSRFFQAKIKAMKKYKLELRKYPHPRSIKGLTILGQERGLAIGAKYAEGFLILREVMG